MDAFKILVRRTKPAVTRIKPPFRIIGHAGQYSNLMIAVAEATRKVVDPERLRMKVLGYEEYVQMKSGTEDLVCHRSG